MRGRVAEPSGVSLAAVPVSASVLTLALTQAAVVPVSREASREVPREVPWSVPALHTAALFTGMRVTEAVLWPEPFAETDLGEIGRHYREAYTRPPLFDPDRRAFEWDGDHWTLNVVGHGLLGSELYFRPRHCGASVFGALAFAAGASAIWEYGFEANGARPSALDLAYTPLAGFVIGEARFVGYRAAGGISDRTLRSVVRILLDPFGEIERAAGSPC